MLNLKTTDIIIKDAIDNLLLSQSVNYPNKHIKVINNTIYYYNTVIAEYLQFTKTIIIYSNSKSIIEKKIVRYIYEVIQDPSCRIYTYGHSTNKELVFEINKMFNNNRSLILEYYNKKTNKNTIFISILKDMIENLHKWSMGSGYFSFLKLKDLEAKILYYSDKKQITDNNILKNTITQWCNFKISYISMDICDSIYLRYNAEKKIIETTLKDLYFTIDEFYNLYKYINIKIKLPIFIDKYKIQNYNFNRSLENKIYTLISSDIFKGYVIYFNKFTYNRVIESLKI